MAISVSLPPTGTHTSRITVRNPRTGDILYSLDEPDAAQLEAVQHRALEAFPKIAAMSVRERLNAMDAVKRYILAHKEDIVQQIVDETGKSRGEAMLTEIFPVLDLIQYYEKTAERTLRDEKQPTPLVLFGKKSRIFYEPLGVVLIISPWNYPFNLSLCPIVTALIAGNAVIFKPSEHTPLRGLVERIFAETPFPKDVVQVVYGGKDTGSRLIDLRPAKIFFTGSERAGKQIMAQAAQYLIPVELELGGKDPMIVFEDVNINRAVNGAIWGAMTNAGQTCTSVERILVHESIYDKFVQELLEGLKHLRTPAAVPSSEFDDRNLDMGFMTPDFQIEKVEHQLADAQRKGATILCGGQRADRTSHYFPPTVVTNVTRDMAIYYDESFGPVVTVIPFKTEEEAIALANDSPYGLSASIWSHDLERAVRVARRIVTGNVSINNVLATQGNSALPFGGIKSSGMGRYKGAHGLYAFSNIKSVMIDRDSGRYEPIWYPYTRKKYEIFSRLVDAVFSGGILNFLKTLWLGVELERMEKRRHLP